MSADVVRAMTFNLWRGGEGGQHPLERSAEVIAAAGADCVGLQETGGIALGGRRPDNGRKLASLLGWHHAEQRAGTAVISRFPLLDVTPERWGVRLGLPSGRHLSFFNAHLTDAPYQPYQLAGIPYSDDPFIRTADEAVRSAHAARGADVAALLREIRSEVSRGSVILTGDFNEPSHLDWTVAAAAAGRCPLAVPWPATVAVAEAELVDAFRAVRPDEIGDRGDTWTPTTVVGAPEDRHDRIDFVFVGGVGARILDARILGEDARHADVVVHPYPSDHRAVVAAVELAEAAGA